MDTLSSSHGFVKSLQIGRRILKDINKVIKFPATGREILDQLQLRVVVFEDRIEVKAAFPLKANPRTQRRPI